MNEIHPTGPALGSLRSVEAVVTTACNLSCSYCYQNRHHDRTMAWPVLEALLDLLLASDHPAPSLTFLGGEPLLALDLMERAAHKLDENGSDSRRVDLLTSTNGTLLDDRAMAFLAGHDVDTQISFDGLAQSARAPGTFEIIEHNMDELRRREPEFFRNRCSVTITVGSHNLQRLADSFHYLLDRGVPEVAVAPLITHDPGWRAGDIERLAHEMAVILATSLAVFENTGDVPFSGFRTFSDDRPGQAMASDAMCHLACTDRLAVDVDGGVSGCVLLAQSYQEKPEGPLGQALVPLMLGDLGSPNLGQRLESFPDTVRTTGIFEHKRDKFSSYGECAHCRFVDVCSICPAAIAHIPGNTNPHKVPDLQCAFNLVLLSCLEGFLTAATPAAQHRKSVSRDPRGV